MSVHVFIYKLNITYLGLLYDTTGTYSLAFFFSGGTAALAICILFQVPIFRAMQGSPDNIKVLKKENKDEKGTLLDAKPSCSSKSDSGISLQDKDISKPSSQHQSEGYIHMSVVKPGSKEKQFQAVLGDDMKVLIVPDKDYNQLRLASSREKLAFCNADLPLIVGQKDLEEFMNNQETDI